MNSRFSIVTAVILAGLSLGACSTVNRVNPFHGKEHAEHDEKAAAKARSKSNRVPLLAAGEELKVSDALKGQDFLIAPATLQSDWPAPGGTLEQSVENVDAAPAFQVAWRRSIGSGSTRTHHVTAPPIAAGGKIFVMDGGADVSAFDARSGQRLWRANLAPKSKRDREAWGGGLAFADGKIYASSGFREVVQLDAASGAIGWRTRTETPIHAAPTVADGRVFVSDVNDEMYAFDAAQGVQLWTYQALTEPARILAASSPAVQNDTVVAAFASGELIALRATNGAELWDTSLSHVSRTNALSEIRDIAGRPVIYKTDVYAVSHADYFAAVDLRTGTARWTLPISATTTPWPSGDVVFVVGQTGQVVCASRDSGGVYWIRDLNEGLKKKNRAIWSSPILARDRLITVSNKGVAVALNPKTGATLSSLKLGAPVIMGPIAVGSMIYAVSDSGELIAIR